MFYKKYNISYLKSSEMYIYQKALTFEKTKYIIREKNQIKVGLFRIFILKKKNVRDEWLDNNGEKDINLGDKKTSLRQFQLGGHQGLRQSESGKHCRGVVL